MSCSNKEAILKTIVMGLFTNAAYLHPSGMYKTIRGDISLKVHLQIDLFQAPFLYLPPSPCSFPMLRSFPLLTAPSPCFLNLFRPLLPSSYFTLCLSQVHPKSVLYTVKMPPYVVYVEINHSKVLVLVLTMIMTISPRMYTCGTSPRSTPPGSSPWPPTSTRRGD